MRDVQSSIEVRRQAAKVHHGGGGNARLGDFAREVGFDVPSQVDALKLIAGIPNRRMYGFPSGHSHTAPSGGQ